MRVSISVWKRGVEREIFSETLVRACVMVEGLLLLE